jgi:hypothetical protein
MARRRSPAKRRTRRSTRKGMPRRSARLAYSRKAQGRVRRVRRKRNPRPIFQTPAFRYGAYAVAGAAAAAVLNNQATTALSEGKEGIANLLKPQFGEARLHAGVVGAGLTFLIASMPRLRAATKANLVALGVGMLTEPTVQLVNNTISGIGAIETAGADAPQVKTQQAPIVARLRAAQMAGNANGYNSANAYNSAASLVGVPVSA